MSSVHQRISAVTTNFNFSMCFSSLGVPGGGAGRSLLSVAGTSARSFYLSLLVIISKPDFYHPFVWGVFKARGLLLWEAGPGSGDFQLPSWPHVEHPHFLQLSPRTPATLLLVSHPHPDHSPVKIQTPDTTLILEALSEPSRWGGQAGRVSLICFSIFPVFSLICLSFSIYALIQWMLIRGHFLHASPGYPIKSKHNPCP